MRENQILILQFQANDGVRHQLHYQRFDRFHGRVSTQGPFSVTATQCSK